MLKSILFAAAISWPVGAQAAQPAPAPASAEAAAPTDGAVKFVTTAIDKFNGGDVDAWVSAHADDAVIVDEFAPHVWAGAGAPKRWIEDYAKYSKANAVSGGRVDYDKPLLATSDGATAYIVLPTTYRFVQKGTKMAEPSSMTFVMKRVGESGWKIASWTFSATAAAAPEK
jgi:ketosteroid isomerase-like protein